MKSHTFVVRIETEDDYDGLTTAEIQSEIQSNLEDVLRVGVGWGRHVSVGNVSVELMSITVRTPQQGAYSDKHKKDSYLPARHPKKGLL